MYACHGHAVPTGSRREHPSDPLELELEIILSPCVEAGNQTWVLCKSSRTDHLAIPLISLSFGGPSANHPNLLEREQSQKFSHDSFILGGDPGMAMVTFGRFGS